MTIRDQRREAAIDRMADYLQQEGLAGASLRPLAKAAGTTDRMLLYYFANREELLAATLERVAYRLLERLNAALPPAPPKPFAELVADLWRALGSEDLRRFMPLWLDLAAGAARGQAPHADLASRIAQGFCAFIEHRLSVEPGRDRGSEAKLLFATVEGLLLVKAVGGEGLADDAMGALGETLGGRQRAPSVRA